jgi:hypothetical protein
MSLQTTARLIEAMPEADTSIIERFRQLVANVMLGAKLSEPDSVLRAHNLRAVLTDLKRYGDTLYQQQLTDELELLPDKGANIGTLRFHLATERKTRIRDGKRGEVLMKALTLAGGDADAAVERYLASGFIKPAAVRDAMAEVNDPEFDHLFEVIEEREVREGKPHKDGLTLHVVDTKFLR